MLKLTLFNTLLMLYLLVHEHWQTICKRDALVEIFSKIYIVICFGFFESKLSATAKL